METPNDDRLPLNRACTCLGLIGSCCISAICLCSARHRDHDGASRSNREVERRAGVAKADSKVETLNTIRQVNVVELTNDILRSDEAMSLLYERLPGNSLFEL